MWPGKSTRRRARAAVVLTLGCVCAGVAGASAESPRPARAVPEGAGAFAPGEAIVRFERGAGPGQRQAARRAARVEFERTVALPNVQVVEVDGAVQAAVRRLERQPGVAYAQPNFRYEATAVEPPDDKFFGDLWGLEDPAAPDPGVGALEAWESSLGEGQVIAVADTGVDLTHPDLVGQLWSNPDELVEGVDDDFNGKVDDVHGYDFVDEDGDPDDYNFHGTHVAGTAAAAINNGEGEEEGIAGVAPKAEIMAVRVLDGDGFGETSDIAPGIAYAAEEGADVINLSLGGLAGEDELTEEAIELAGTEGVVVVAAAGNEGVDNDDEPHTPCALLQTNLICVAALERNGSLAFFSNWGAESVDLAAPGTGILSAKTDYGPPQFSDDFESGFGSWGTAEINGGEEWGLQSPGAGGSASLAADSPGGDYNHSPPGSGALAVSEAFKSTGVDLEEERGCRLHFRLRYEIEPPLPSGFFRDALEVGAFDGAQEDIAFFAGTSPGFPGFLREEVSISDLDGQDQVRPVFAVVSNESKDFDGAGVDDVRLICRDATYVNDTVERNEYDLPNVGNYVNFSGTSMASPHVAGVVALVQSAAPGLNPQEVVEAVLDGTSAMPGAESGRPTATFGIADACKAIAVATGENFEEACPASSVPEVPKQPEGDEGDSGDDSPGPGPGPVVLPPPPPDPPPHTFIKKRPGKVVFTPWRRGRAAFGFRSNEPGVLFFCQFDRKRWRRCGPWFVRWFKVGRHVLRVKARDAAGNLDPTPAVHRFRVRRVSKERFARIKRANRRARHEWR